MKYILRTFWQEVIMNIYFEFLLILRRRSTFQRGYISNYIFFIYVWFKFYKTFVFIFYLINFKKLSFEVNNGCMMCIYQRLIYCLALCYVCGISWHYIHLLDYKYFYFIMKFNFLDWHYFFYFDQYFKYCLFLKILRIYYHFSFYITKHLFFI